MKSQWFAKGSTLKSTKPIIFWAKHPQILCSYKYSKSFVKVFVPLIAGNFLSEPFSSYVALQFIGNALLNFLVSLTSSDLVGAS